MNPTQRLHDSGQSLWLDNITRNLLTEGTLQRYIDELAVTELTSNPTIFDHAINNSSDYDAAIRARLGTGLSTEALFFEIALEDIGRAADLFRPIHARSVEEAWRIVDPVLKAGTPLPAVRRSGRNGGWQHIDPVRRRGHHLQQYE